MARQEAAGRTVDGAEINPGLNSGSVCQNIQRQTVRCLLKALIRRPQRITPVCHGSGQMQGVRGCSGTTVTAV